MLQPPRLSLPQPSLSAQVAKPPCGMIIVVWHPTAAEGFARSWAEQLHVGRASGYEKERGREGDQSSLSTDLLSHSSSETSSDPCTCRLALRHWPINGLQLKTAMQPQLSGGRAALTVAPRTVQRASPSKPSPRTTNTPTTTQNEAPPLPLPARRGCDRRLGRRRAQDRRDAASGVRPEDKERR